MHRGEETSIIQDVAGSWKHALLSFRLENISTFWFFWNPKCYTTPTWRPTFCRILKLNLCCPNSPAKYNFTRVLYYINQWPDKHILINYADANFLSSLIVFVQIFRLRVILLQFSSPGPIWAWVYLCNIVPNT